MNIWRSQPKLFGYKTIAALVHSVYLYAKCHLLVVTMHRSVKVPAPVYYADLAAFRGRLLLSGEDEEATTDTQSIATADIPLMALN